MPGRAVFLAARSDSRASAVLQRRYRRPDANFFRGFGRHLRVNRGVASSGPLPEAEVVRLYRDTVQPLYRYVSRRVGGDRGLAEDLVHETWMRALDAWPRSGVPDEPLAWLIRVARNTMVSHFRHVQPQLVDPATLDLEAAGTVPDDRDAAAVINWGMARLRRRHAEVLEAYYFDGKDVREIAAERAVSERAIEGRLRRAREKLKTVLRKIWRPADAQQRTAARETTHADHTRT